MKPSELQESSAHSENLKLYPNITGYHAHVYFDAATKPTAAKLRELLEHNFGDSIQLGRWHERPIGPHPHWSYQVAFMPELLAEILPYLMLNRSGLTILLHPETGDDLADHTEHVVWLGISLPLNLEVFLR